MSEGPLLQVSGLTAGYGKIVVLRDVALTIGGGEAVALLGPNGAGKTTLRRAMSSMLVNGANKMIRRTACCAAYCSAAAVPIEKPTTELRVSSSAEVVPKCRASAASVCSVPLRKLAGEGLPVRAP